VSFGSASKSARGAPV